MRVRLPERSAGKLKTIEQLNDPVEFLREVMDLFENYYRYEGETPVLYDPLTGKPIGFEWKPTSEFSKVIYTHGGFSADVKISPTIREFFVEIVENGPLTFWFEDKEYVVTKYMTSYNGGIVTAGVKIESVYKTIGDIDA